MRPGDFKNQSMHNCQQKCLEKCKDCLFFTYFDESQYCIVECLNRQEETNITSGTKECFLQEKAYDLMNCYEEISIKDYWPIWEYQLDANNVSDCWKKCEGMESCLLFSYDDAKKSCILTTRDYNLTNPELKVSIYTRSEDFVNPKDVKKQTKAEYSSR